MVINLILSMICLTVLVSSLLVLKNELINRKAHSSWASPSGLMLLGDDSRDGRDGRDGSTTEKIQPDGTSTASFKLKHSTLYNYEVRCIYYL